MVSSVPARKTAGRRVAISCMCHFGPTGILQSQEKLNCPKKSTQEKYLSSSIWVAITKYHRWEYLNDRHLFPTVLEIRSTKSKCRHGRLHPEVSLLDLQAATTLLCAHMTSFLCTCRETEEERTRSLLSFLIRPLILSY